MSVGKMLWQISPERECEHDYLEQRGQELLRSSEPPDWG